MDAWTSCCRRRAASFSTRKGFDRSTASTCGSAPCNGHGACFTFFSPCKRGERRIGWRPVGSRKPRRLQARNSHRLDFVWRRGTSQKGREKEDEARKKVPPLAASASPSHRSRHTA